MLPSLTDDPSFVQMFLDEARIAARIEHPNVAATLDLGEERGLLFLVMEWVDGEPLSVLMREAALQHVEIPLPVVLRVMVDACAGLHAAHELRDGDRPMDLVHRDVSPQNILITASGVVKIVDFGVAKVAHRTSAPTSPGSMKGKVSYMAPEQALGQPIDRRADLFSLGVVLFQLVTGKHPFRGDNELATLHNLLSTQPPRASQSMQQPIPRGLDDLIVSTLSTARESRPATARELAERLERSIYPRRLASTEEVAALVSTIVGDRLAERRALIRRALEAQDAQATAKPITSRSEELDVVTVPDARPTGMTSELDTDSVPPIKSDGRHPRWWVVGGAAALVGAFALGRRGAIHTPLDNGEIEHVGTTSRGTPAKSTTEVTTTERAEQGSSRLANDPAVVSTPAPSPLASASAVASSAPALGKPKTKPAKPGRVQTRGPQDTSGKLR
jgi:serine/threonine-protein kinase